MQGVTERSNLNWLFGVSCVVLMSSWIWGSSDRISGEVPGVCFSVNLPGSKGISGCEFQKLLSSLWRFGTDEDNRWGLGKLTVF